MLHRYGGGFTIDEYQNKRKNGQNWCPIGYNGLYVNPGVLVVITQNWGWTKWGREQSKLGDKTGHEQNLRKSFTLWRKRILQRTESLGESEVGSFGLSRDAPRFRRQ